MPTHNTGGGGPIEQTNKRQKQEVEDDIIDEIRDPNDIRRDRNSLYLSTNYHLDSKSVEGGYKVEIQNRSGTKRTVACVVVANSCNSIVDLRAALVGSLGSRTVWNAT